MVGVSYSVSKGLWIQWQIKLCDTLEKKQNLKYKHGVKKVYVMETDNEQHTKRG